VRAAWGHPLLHHVLRPLGMDLMIEVSTISEFSKGRVDEGIKWCCFDGTGD
jgi:hypothetical protein